MDDGRNRQPQVHILPSTSTKPFDVRKAIPRISASCSDPRAFSYPVLIAADSVINSAFGYEEFLSLRNWIYDYAIYKFPQKPLRTNFRFAHARVRPESDSTQLDVSVASRYPSRRT